MQRMAWLGRRHVGNHCCGTKNTAVLATTAAVQKTLPCWQTLLRYTACRCCGIGLSTAAQHTASCTHAYTPAGSGFGSSIRWIISGPIQSQAPRYGSLWSGRSAFSCKPEGVWGVAQGHTHGGVGLEHTAGEQGCRGGRGTTPLEVPRGGGWTEQSRAVRQLT